MPLADRSIVAVYQEQTPEPHAINHELDSPPVSYSAEGLPISMSEELHTAIQQHQVQHAQNSVLSQITFSFILLMIWAAVALMVALRTTLHYMKFQRLLRNSCEKVNNPAVIQLYKGLGVELKLKRLPVLCVSTDIDIPMIAGIFSKTIIIPESLIKNQSQNLRYYLLHELVHYKRRDIIYMWAIQLCVCLHWFNPLAYIMKRELLSLCELSCDARVLKNLEANEVEDYGNMLLSTVEMMVVAKPLPTHGVAWRNNKT